MRKMSFDNTLLFTTHEQIYGQWGKIRKTTVMHFNLFAEH